MIREIIVAIDEDGAIRVRADHRGEAVGGEIGEGKVYCALDVAAREGVGRAGVEEQRAGFRRLRLERVEGDKALDTRGSDAGGERLEPRIVDLRVRLRKSGRGDECERETQGAVHDDPPSIWCGETRPRRLAGR